MKRSLSLSSEQWLSRVGRLLRTRSTAVCADLALQQPRQRRCLSSSDVRVQHNKTSDPSKGRIPNDGLTLGDFVQQHRRAALTKNHDATSHHPSTANAPSFHIKTYGCQMNVNDTDIVRAILLERGFIEATTEDEANVWLTNTCAIRDKAEQKVFQRLKTLKRKRQPQNPNRKSNQTKTTNRYHGQAPIIGLLGCMAERLQEDLLDQQLADLVVGPDAYRDLPNLIDDLLVPDTPDQPHLLQAINVDLSLDETYQDIVPVRNAQAAFPQSAFVSIQRGCSNRCSFCIVPFTRGQERSRPLESIVAEVQQLVEEENLKEVVLLGQNVNSYHDRSPAAMAAKPVESTPGLSNDGFRNRIRRPTSGGYTFVDLVEQIADISPELRVRFTSPHPKDYPVELLHCMAERPNVCNQLHMPAQSGSTSMLKRMKRGYSREAYLELIDTVRTIIPDVALSSDFIAGFCQETAEEHQDTVSLLEYVQYEQAFLFAYSMREKTYAHRALEDTVPANVKQERLQELIDVFRTKVHAKNENHEVGKLRLVLIEGPSKKQPKLHENASSEDGTWKMWHGRTDQNKRILFPVLEEHHGLGSSSTSPTATALEEDWVLERLHLKKTSCDPSISVVTTAKTTMLQPGDYAIVEVTEAKGTGLRGKLLWKTTLSQFAKWQSQQLSELDEVQLEGFKQDLQKSLSAPSLII